MSQGDAATGTASDTARWAATYRARETERPDPLFRDPFARRLAGERGEEVFAALPFSERNTWLWVTRTYLFDQFIGEQVRDGADLVVHLGAGLDARPYRMALPASLRWVEVDRPEVIAYKEGILRGEKPACALERVPLDLSDGDARRGLFDRLGRGADKALILTEGFLIYRTEEEVGALARDLAVPAGFRKWVVDLTSPGLLRTFQQQAGAELIQGGAPLKFAPSEGAGFFSAYGWPPADVRSLLQTAARLKRLSLRLRLMATLPESTSTQGSRPWAAVCLLARP